MSSESFFKSSFRATEAAPAKVNHLWASIQDRFFECPVGMSFVVAHNDDYTERQLRTLVSRKAKSAGKIYRVLKHTIDDKVSYEIARIADEREMQRASDVPQKATVNPWAKETA